MTTGQTQKKPNVFKEEGGEAKPMEVNKKTSIGLEPNIAGLVCYLFGFVSAIILLLIEKNSRYVRFHAMQSLLMSVALLFAVFTLTIIPFIGWVMSLLIIPLSFILWIFMMYKAYQGEWYKLPWIGDFTKQLVDKA